MLFVPIRERTSRAHRGAAFAPRTVIVQARAYAEHEFLSLGDGTGIDAPVLEVRLDPGAGGRLEIARKRYAHAPTLAFPWDRGWKVGR